MKDEALITSVGRNIRKAREAKGLSLRAFSASIGIDYTSLSKLERGLIDPRVSTVLRIGDALGMTFEELFKEQ